MTEVVAFFIGYTIGGIVQYWINYVHWERWLKSQNYSGHR